MTRDFAYTRPRKPQADYTLADKLIGGLSAAGIVVIVAYLIQAALELL